MSNEKKGKIDIIAVKPDLIKKLNNDIIEMKNKDLQVDKMKKKIEEILLNPRYNNYNNNINMNNSVLISHSHNFEDLIVKAKQKPGMKTDRYLNPIKIDNQSNTDKYQDLLSN